MGFIPPTYGFPCFHSHLFSILLNAITFMFHNNCLFSQILSFCNCSHFCHPIPILPIILWPFLWLFIFVVYYVLLASPYFSFIAIIHLIFAIYFTTVTFIILHQLFHIQWCLHCDNNSFYLPQYLISQIFFYLSLWHFFVYVLTSQYLPSILYFELQPFH